MSNNLVSQQMSIQNIQMGQLEPISNKLDSSMHMGMMGQVVNSPALQQMSMPNMQMGIMGPNSTDASSQQISVSSHQTQPFEYVPNNHILQKLPVSNMQMGQMGQRSYNLVSDQFLPSNKQLGGMETMFNNVGQQSSMLSKRKTLMDSNLDTPGLQKLVSNKRVAHMEHRPWLHQASSPNKLSAQMQSHSTSNASGSPRPQAQLKRSASSAKAGPQQLSAQKNQSGQPSPKYQSESSESVRSKLRESLGAALALVSQGKDKSSSVGKESQNNGTQGTSQTSGCAGGAFNHASEENRESLPEKGENKGQNSTLKIPSNNAGDYAETSKIDGENCQSISSSQDESVLISDGLFVKDELLQGNGLSWVLESDMGLAEKSESQTVQEQPDLGDSCKVSGGKQTDPPEVVASKIEAELYKLYGGVNKKYKEKGRSLLFNLKDRNNPELRERVMSGDIAPDRLCAMSAEELASKELSEWRMAKAEELAQMVVLPDSDGDMRRLVKKTHKGEFQVEVEPQDSISVEVAVGASSLTQMRPKPKEKDGSSPSRPDKKKNRGNATSEKSSSEDQNVIMIPSSDGSDLMQGLMVDDELKDAEFLPPIVSLDEFMESLNAEPPFENLPVDAEKATPVSDKDDSLVRSDSKSPDVATSGKPGAVDLASAKSDSDGKSAEVLVKSETTPVCITKGEIVWEGLLQLNLSGSASVMALFKSGEKAFAKAWAGLVEIKGRVRLDAFEKFLQELPMSRSRAVMAVQFVCKEGSAESERAMVREVADSYVVDERVGFAEPASGVELYVCPPDSKTREMLGKVLPKDQLDALNSIDNGLIGVIVWRKPHITSTISPNHKHNSKKQNSTSRKNLEKDGNMNVNVASKHPPSRGDGPYSFSEPNEDEGDDDVPPGFGPPAGATRDEDDLPEFNFSSGPVTSRPQLVKQSGVQGQGMPFHTHSQSLPRPVDQMRELVHKYGQPETNNSRGLMAQPWNDDDDDMPEWHPDDAKPQPQAVFMHNHSIQQPILRSHVMQQTQYQHIAPQQQTLNLQPQVNVMQNVASAWPQQQGQWMVPNSGPHGLPAYQPNNGQPWRRDAPSSRGF